MDFVPFPEIQSFNNVVKAVNAYPHIAPGGKFIYRGKVKLHGTNAAVQIGRGEIAAQSRSKIITPNDDNAGFARWVDGNKEYFSTLNPGTTIFGEWCGQGIMKGTAINQIGKKVFAVFALITREGDDTNVIHDPETIKQYLGSGCSDVHVLPWITDNFLVDFTDRDSLKSTVDILNGLIERIEPIDPWVKETFGVEGVCEGVVFYPQAESVHSDRKLFSDLVFKAKGEKHQVKQADKPVEIDAAVVASIEEFVKYFVTSGRCEQGASVVGVDTKNTGKFLQWLAADIIKESKDELEASNLTWDQVQRSVQTAGRAWYIARCNQI